MLSPFVSPRGVSDAGTAASTLAAGWGGVTSAAIGALSTTHLAYAASILSNVQASVVISPADSDEWRVLMMHLQHAIASNRT